MVYCFKIWRFCRNSCPLYFCYLHFFSISTLTTPSFVSNIHPFNAKTLCAVQPHVDGTSSPRLRYVKAVHLWNILRSLSNPSAPPGREKKRQNHKVWPMGFSEFHTFCCYMFCEISKLTKFDLFPCWVDFFWTSPPFRVSSLSKSPVKRGISVTLGSQNTQKMSVLHKSKEESFTLKQNC